LIIYGVVDGEEKKLESGRDAAGRGRRTEENWA